MPSRLARDILGLHRATISQRLGVILGEVEPRKSQGRRDC